jgi:hypothetical protein
MDVVTTTMVTATARPDDEKIFILEAKEQSDTGGWVAECYIDRM